MFERAYLSVPRGGVVRRPQCCWMTSQLKTHCCFWVGRSQFQIRTGVFRGFIESRTVCHRVMLHVVHAATFRVQYCYQLVALCFYCY